MANVRTNNTTGLISNLLEAITGLDSTVTEAAGGVVDLGAQLTTGEPSGKSEDGTYAWTSSLSSTKGDFSETYAASVDDDGWSTTGTVKYGMTGTALNVTSGQALAKGYTYAETLTALKDSIGFSASESSSVKQSATLSYDINAASSMQITALTSSETFKGSWAGYDASSGFFGETASSSYTRALKFAGVASVAVSAYQASLTSLKISSLTLTDKGVDATDGTYSTSKLTSTYTRSLTLGSTTTGLTYTAGTDSASVTGDVTALTYSDKTVNAGEDSTLTSDEYFQYVAAGSENIAEALTAAINGGEAELDALRQELLKGNDAFTLTGGVGGFIEAGAGNDKVTGAAGSDTLNGEDGNDSLLGMAADDLIYGGLGNDTVDGGVGNDQIEGGSGNDSLLGGLGKDWMLGDAGNDYMDGGAGRDTLYGGAGNDSMLGNAEADLLYGDAGADTLFGGVNSDYLFGGADADLLSGDDGNDYLDGGAANDTLSGGNGQDQLTGGAGADSLTGGAGRDIFIFSNGDSGLSSAYDTINDFAVKQDSIKLNFSFTTADIQQLGSGSSMNALLTAAEALDKKVVVGYDATAAYLFVDTDGNNALDMTIKLVGINSTTVGQIQIISGGDLIG